MELWGKGRLGVTAAIALFALLPATACAETAFTVNDTSSAPLEASATECHSTDPGPENCTLRAAIELADEVGGATINVPAGTFLGTYAIDGGADVTIIGAGAGKTVIDGASDDTVFSVDEAGSSLTLEKLTVEHGGDTDEGGGIYAGEETSATVEDSTITENVANDEGGGIYGEFSSSITVKGSTISHNEARLGGGIDGESEASVTVEDSTITENSAGGYGGGIFGEPGATVTVARSSVTDNTAEEGDGGGIFGGDIERLLADTARPATVCDTAHASGAARAKGAAEPDSGLFGGVTIEQSTIAGNTADIGDESEGNGGGVAVVFEEECEQPVVRTDASAHAAARSARPAVAAAGREAGLTVEQSAIADNSAEGDGGGIYEDVPLDPVVNSTIAGNFAEDDGGGVYAHGDDHAELISDTVYDNTVEEPVEIETRTGVRPAFEEGEVGNNLGTGEVEDDSTIDLRNTIVAEPTSGLPNCEGRIGGVEDGNNYNLDFPSTPSGGATDTCGMSTAENDQPGVEPGFETGELANNGGPTQTIALAASSHAINVVPIAGDCHEAGDGPNGVDQRGVLRPGIPGDACDVGAYEYQLPVVTTPETPAPIIAPQPAAGAVLPFTISVPKACSSLRDIRIHIQNVKQFGIVSAVISIDGHSTRTVRGKHLTTAIDLRGLPKGTFTVEITARTRGGHTLTGKRVYHTCHTKLPGHSYLPL